MVRNKMVKKITNNDKGFSLVELTIGLLVFSIVAIALIGWQKNERKHAKVQDIAASLNALDAAYFQINMMVGHIPVPKQAQNQTIVSNQNDTGYVCVARNVNSWKDKVDLPLFYGTDSVNLKVTKSGQVYLWFPTLNDFKEYVRKNNLHGAVYRRFYPTVCNFGDSYFSQGLGGLQNYRCFDTELRFALNDAVYREAVIHGFRPEYGTRTLRYTNDPSKVAVACHVGKYSDGSVFLDYYVGGSIYYIPNNLTSSPVIYKYFLPPQYLGQEKPEKYAVEQLNLVPEDPIICGSAVMEPMRKLWATPSSITNWGDDIDVSDSRTRYSSSFNFFYLPPRLVYNDCSSAFGKNPPVDENKEEQNKSFVNTSMMLSSLKSLLDPRINFKELAATGYTFEFVVQNNKLIGVKISGLDEEAARVLESMLAGRWDKNTSTFLFNSGQGYDVKFYDNISCS